MNYIINNGKLGWQLLPK